MYRSLKFFLNIFILLILVSACQKVESPPAPEDKVPSQVTNPSVPAENNLSIEGQVLPNSKPVEPPQAAAPSEGEASPNMQTEPSSQTKKPLSW